MSDDDIHDMMDRAHYAEIGEARLRIAYGGLKAENERLTRERDEAFRMSRCECGPDECCANLVKLHEENARLRGALRYVRRTINPISSWVTIGEAVPMVENAIACIDAALSPRDKGDE
jgi:hypothetical protein